MLLVTRADLLKNRLSLIVRVNVVLNRTVVVASDWRFDNLCGSHLQSQSDLYQVSWWYYTLVIDLIGQLRRDVIGSLSSVKPWCYWLWRLVISNWCVSIRLLSQLNSRLLLVKLSSKTNYERITIWLTIDNSLTLIIDGSKRTNYWLRVFIANNEVTNY